MAINLKHFTRSQKAQPEQAKLFEPEPQDQSSLNVINSVMARDTKQTTGIEWTNHTWNPFVGCSVHTAGCTNCYAMKQAGVITAPHYIGTVKGKDDKLVWTGKLNQSPAHIVNKPLNIKGHAMIFVNSMSDFFHEKAEYAWQLAAMKVIEKTPQHVYQILTKRPENIQKFVDQYGPFPDNVWVGITMEREDYRFRIDILRKVPAKVRFMSVEPLIGSAGVMDLSGIHWVIVGGESGPGARVMKIEWVREVRDQCIEQGVPFFFKQWGKPEFNPLWAEAAAKGVSSYSYVKEHDPIGKGGSLVDGVEWKQFPKG